MLYPELEGNFGLNANVQLLDGDRAFGALLADLDGPGTVYTWTYLLEEKFFIRLFGDRLAREDLHMIIDHRMRPGVRDLLQNYPRFFCYAHSNNRTMHDKTLLFPHRGITWVTTHNLTAGSWSLSTNRAARIRSKSLAMELYTQWEIHRTHSRTVPRLAPAG